MEIDQHFIAAILTVIGYSMNDTVLIDRVREF
jgi:SecD/SecF fusion protein